MLHIYDTPLSDRDSVHDAVERMQLNLVEITGRADQPRRASEASAKNESVKTEAYVRTACGIHEEYRDAQLQWTDLMNLVEQRVPVSQRLEARLRLYRDARVLNAAPETAIWASQKGNWQAFKIVLEAHARSRLASSNRTVFCKHFFAYADGR